MHSLSKRLGALLLAGALLTGPAYAAGAGMSHFSPDTPYTPFPDVAAGAWYAGDVEQAVRLGLFNGKQGGVFDPLGSLTLAEAVTLAAKARSTYDGGGFTPGGSPWYKNAVNYGLDKGFLTRGDYQDYTQPATRADMAGIFARALPLEEYGRINRIGAIPDVDGATPQADAIFLLYGAGILTGDGTGAFHPGDTVTRAEAAAILNRLALPAGRRTVQLSAGGSPVTSPDGSASLLLPQGWSAGEGQGDWTAAPQTGEVSLTLTRSDRQGALTDYTAAALDALRVEAGGAILVTAQPARSMFRGLSGYTFCVEDTDGAQREVYCLENGGGYYTLTLQAKPRADQSALDALCRLAYSLDLAL